MDAAITAALRGPEQDRNPRVGCVIVPGDGTSPVTGWHRGAGTAHAEVDALQLAGAAARGGTAFVTLEPCNHVGRTGPCSEALIEAGIARVVYAVADPSPQAGGGAARLVAQGISVEQGVGAEAAEAINHTWLHATRMGRPFVTLKSATTLDGRVAAADGSSRWITGAASRADAHSLRARCQAIIVGIGTVFADDPQLTVRDAAGSVADRQPLRVVVGHRPIPAGARVIDDAAPTLQLWTRNPHVVLRELRRRGVHHVLVEGGPSLASAFLREGLVDEMVVYLAPAVLGGGPTAFTDVGVRSIDQARRFSITDVRSLGADVRLILTPTERD